jgi:hypothetical protein
MQADRTGLGAVSKELRHSDFATAAHAAILVLMPTLEINATQAVLRFEASWPEGKRHPSLDRWGGGPSADRTQIPSGILESLPITFLPVFRDAEAALAPGIRSRLALLLKDLVTREGEVAKSRIEGIFKKANDDLEADGLIKPVSGSLKGRTQSIAGSDYAPSAIRAAPAELDRILRTLCVQMEGIPIAIMTDA